MSGRGRLAWWLGPWAPQGRAPGAVTRTRLAQGGGSYLYTPRARAARAAWLVSPALHPDGPDDPRLDRLARVLAAAGAVVLSPRSPTLAGLRLGAGAIAELAAARAALVARPEAAGLPLRVVAPSVGSLAALHLAADPAAAVSRTVLLGGYVDAAALVRSMCGGEPVPRDPTNQPVAFATFVEHLPVAIADRARLVAAWDDVVGRAPRLAPGRHRPGRAHHATVRARAARVPAADRALFLVGCGLVPGGAALAAGALATGAYAYLELGRLAAAVPGELHAFHGPADPVVPIEQQDALAAAAPRARVHRLAGLAHGGPRPLAELVRGLAPRAVLGELRGFAALVAALAP